MVVSKPKPALKQVKTAARKPVAVVTPLTKVATKRPSRAVVKSISTDLDNLFK